MNVIFILEKVALKIKNDTVEYDVSKFKRFDDRKIINVLKSLVKLKKNLYIC